MDWIVFGLAYRHSDGIDKSVEEVGKDSPIKQTNDHMSTIVSIQIINWYII